VTVQQFSAPKLADIE